MNENIKNINMIFEEADSDFICYINIDGHMVYHFIKKECIANQHAAALLMITKALGFEPKEVLNCNILGIQE